jgi:Fe-S oxidoreductase
MAETMATCIGCKACRSACPPGVDVARMRIEVLHQAMRDRAPRSAVVFPPRLSWITRLGWRFGVRERVPGMRRLVERWLGLAARRSLPRLRRDTFLRGFHAQAGAGQGREVVLFADCFGNHLAPENLQAAVRVLRAAGWQVHVAMPSASDPDDQRPLCCGRTLLARGEVDAARVEARRTLQALAPHLERGLDVIGLEPACLLTMRDEFLALGLGEAAQALAGRALLFEEFVAREHAAGRFPIRAGAVPWGRALVQPHCHQHAFGTVDAMRYALNLVPGLSVDVLDAGCCGMGDGFGLRAENFALSMRIAAQGPMPALSAADPQTVLIADGTGCRLQIADAAQRPSMHLARVLDMALGGSQAT